MSRRGLGPILSIADLPSRVFLAQQQMSGYAGSSLSPPRAVYHVDYRQVQRQFSVHMNLRRAQTFAAYFATEQHCLGVCRACVFKPELLHQGGAVAAVPLCIPLAKESLGI